MTTTQRRTTPKYHKTGQLPMPDQGELLLTASKAAALLGQSRTTFYRSGLDREIPCIVLSGRRLWHRQDIEETAQRLRERAHQREAS